MKIKNYNYFSSSYGRFKVQPTKWAELALGHIEIECHSDPLTGDPAGYSSKQTHVRLGNRIWTPNYVSYNARHNSLSAYWTSEDGQYLLRLSDHWSEGCKSVHKVGRIAHCLWALDGRPQRAFKGFHLGIIKFSDMKSR